VTFCLSKGLCAPVGSVLCGSTGFIHQARRARKALGGGMRQAGVLAAAGIVALNEMVGRLCEDHEHARLLAVGLSRLPGVRVDVDIVRTNMVFFELADEVPLSAEDVIERLRENAGVWLGGNGSRGFRAVTHYWIGAGEVQTFLDALKDVLAKA
jgi:threonine aldolase